MAQIQNSTKSHIVLSATETKTRQKRMRLAIDGQVVEEIVNEEYEAPGRTIAVPPTLPGQPPGRVEVSKEELKNLKGQKTFMGLIQQGKLLVNDFN